MKRPLVIIGAVVVGVVALILYFQQLPPTGVETQSEDSTTMLWLTLAISVVSFLTALVGLLQKFIELRQTAKR